ncbi:hypothetical protein L9F63_024979, partial [Diploptera punctata]
RGCIYFSVDFEISSVEFLSKELIARIVPEVSKALISVLKETIKLILDSENLNTVMATTLQNKPIPHVIVAENAFALDMHLMKPYPGQYASVSKEIIFNYRLSRARRVVENVFGILTAVFRVLRNQFRVRVQKFADTISFGNCVLKKECGYIPSNERVQYEQGSCTVRDPDKTSLSDSERDMTTSQYDNDSELNKDNLISNMSRDITG